MNCFHKPDFALLLARSDGVVASSVNYGVAGPADSYTEDALRGACPIVGSFGGKDRNLRRATQKLEWSLKTLGIDHDVKEYLEAGTPSLTTTAGRALGVSSTWRWGISR